MKISEIITDKYKLRIPPTVYYELLADVREVEEDQEPQSFKWCTDCREYDQEKHCCHRWSKVIRDTVEEMKQEPKMGHWIKTPKAVMGEGYMWYCDKCEYQVYQDSSRDYPSEKYCPNCGCRMFGPQESER